MPKENEFECIECGFQSPILYGKCPRCNNWNSLVKISAYSESDNRSSGKEPKNAKALNSIKNRENLKNECGIPEFDRAMGGGVEPGSVILLGGEPGIGKSTLLLEIAGRLTKKGEKVLYYSGEESELQIKKRAERLKLNSEGIFLLSMASLEDIKSEIDNLKPSTIIVDSIQTINSSSSSGIPGSLQKIRFITNELREIAKEREITIFIIGHITKDGQFAGPKMLEHMVDTVLYFHGEPQSDIRILRVEKNRFGSINEVGIFMMSPSGLTSVSNPTEAFLQKHEILPPGTSIIPALKGKRSILLEIQALVAENPFSNNPRRVTVGFDPFRLSMIIAVIEKILKLPFYKSDVFLNVTGGINIRETAGDIAVCASLISSIKNIQLPGDIIFFGELGLTGEIRGVNLRESRIRESARQGFKKFIIPKYSGKIPIKSIQVSAVGNISELYSKIRDYSVKI